MSDQSEFNPIKASRNIEESYREYIAATIHFSDPGLQRQLEEILHEPGYLAKGPFLEAAPPYTKAETVRQLVEGKDHVLCQSMLTLGGGDPKKFDPDRPLYVHQVRAIKKAAAGRNYAVVTGTGSGKTECFLLPILNDILKEFESEGPSSGVRAMILYPMNALANDQLKRLRELLKGTKVTFGRYTGDTVEREDKALRKWKEENPGQKKLPNEIISRERIRQDPPNILLTNYAMLEYLLLRPKDAPLFGSAFGSKWRHIAVDEAHIYSGSLGTEIAYLIRRLKARIASETGNPVSLHCYATSATIGSEEDMPKVAKFAQDLFGEPFSCDVHDLDVITSEKDKPQDALDETPWGSLPLAAWADLRSLLEEPDVLSEREVRSCLSRHGVDEAVLGRMDGKGALLGLGTILLGEKSTAKLVRRCEELFDLTDPKSVEELEIDGLDDGSLTVMVEVLSGAQRSAGVPIISSRYHSFLRAPEGLFINLATRRLTPHKRVEEKYKGDLTTPVYEVSVCRHCGQHYVLGHEESSSESRCSWFSPRHEETDDDDESTPRVYYRVLPDVGEADEDEVIEWLCPVCGSLHNVEEGGSHLFEHDTVSRIPIAKNESEDRQADEFVARCHHCGYQSNVAIQPMRVSPEAAGSVVCYDLVREIPPFKKEEVNEGAALFGLANEARRAGSVICFSDKRQDAAFFAPAMERTYGAVTRRQLIREAVESYGDAGCTPSAVANWIASNANRKYPGMLMGDKSATAVAWVVDELEAEDSRNSLDGLGVIKVEPTEVYEELNSPQVMGAVKTMINRLDGGRFGWLTPEDYILFFKVCLETLREHGAVMVDETVSKLRNNHMRRTNMVVMGSDSVSYPKGMILYSGSLCGGENKRSTFIRRYARKLYGEKVDRDDAAALLCNLYEFTRSYLGSYFKGEGYLEERGDGFSLSKDIWRMKPASDGDFLYRCESCGCESHLNTNGVCMTSKCDGTVERLTPAEAASKDRYYKTTYRQDPLPVTIKEHTAQLSSKNAREVQSEFIKGDTNILSCTTTFELGVDVGDLRAIFMRNVPPATANYTQRAGRVGRRAGKPGFAVTFARLRPHDIAHFDNPPRIIAGDTRVPIVYMDNPAIAIRHVFAVAMSEYFRYSADHYGIDCSSEYDAFMSLESKNPDGLSHLREFLGARPVAVAKQLRGVVPSDLPVSNEIDTAGWGWVDKLVGEPRDGSAGGRLVRVHELKHSDYEGVREHIERYKLDDQLNKVSRLYSTLNTLKKEQTIKALAEGGVLPKYGFPTDLVDLHVPDEDISGENKLSLQRGLRQAIYEYAPSNEVVAGGKLWKSVGFRVPRGRELVGRRYGHCEKCKTFVCPIDALSEKASCPVCGAEVTLRGKMLIPSYGFRAVEVPKGIGLRKPRMRGYAKVYFSQKWPNEARTSELSMAGGVIRARYIGNGQLCALNAPHENYKVCRGCNSGWLDKMAPEHTTWCDKKSFVDFVSLGTVFVSDVLGLSFDLPGFDSADKGVWNSVMWALFTAAARLLEISETELGGTMRPDDGLEGMEVMIYDNVPGGAGHAEQLFGMADELIREAYRVVDGHCGCGGETCCYGCIANYHNQNMQKALSRQAAKDLLGALLGIEED